MKQGKLDKVSTHAESVQPSPWFTAYEALLADEGIMSTIVQVNQLWQV